LRRLFTLLEMMITIVLLALAASIIGIRLGKALEEKHFQTAIDRLDSELESCRRLALNMQADWNAVLEKKNDLFLFYRTCPEAAKTSVVQWKAPCRLRWNNEPAEKISFLFSATGKMEPAGLMEIVGSRQCVRWSFPERFRLFERKDGALQRPDSER
jgi:prepilin-type N-terminal cleavage/methylation domain-containing protein